MPDVVRVEPDADVRTRLTPMYRVLIHNDDVTPMDFVVKVLQEIFKLEIFRAIKIMFEAHTSGVAHVVTEPLEKAEFHVEQCRSLSRARGFPLTFSIEPES